MKYKPTLILALLALFCYQMQAIAQLPNLTGTWILNLEKSKLESKPDGLTSSVFIFTQDNENFSLTRYHIYGEKEKKISFKMTADGKTRRVKLFFKGQLINKENSLQASIWRKHFSNVVNYSFGENSNELIADEVVISNTDNHHNIWVFERQFKE